MLVGTAVLGGSAILSKKLAIIEARKQQEEETTQITEKRTTNDSERQNKASREELKQFLADISQKYGGNYYELYKVIECESNWNPSAIGDDGRSFGIGQFLKTTFDENCEGDYYSVEDQIKCMAIMFQKGMKNRWTCWKILYN